MTRRFGKHSWGIPSLRVDASILFVPVDSGGTLSVRTARGGVVTIIGQVTKTLLYMFSTVVLARLLSPDDYGLVGMATTVIVFAQMFKDVGLSSATIQAGNITHQQVSTLFWVNLFVSGLLALAVLGLAPFMGIFYGRKEVVGLVSVLAVLFLIWGVSIQHEALLRRHMRFAPLALSQVLGHVAYAVSAIGAASLGMKYWALVVGSLMMALVSSATVLWACPWLPGRPRRGIGVREMVFFGGDVAVHNAANYFARNADYILIGRLVGGEGLGIYTRAYQLFMQPISQVVGPLASAALPTLSVLQGQPDRFRRYYRLILDITAMLSVPIAMYMVIEPEFIIGVLLGERWLEASIVLRWLAVAGLFQAVASTLGLVLVSCGQSRQYMHMGVTNAIAMVIGFTAGISHGIEGVALGYAAANVLYWVPAIIVFTRSTPIRHQDFWRSLWWPLLAAIVAAGSSLAFGGAIATGTAWVHPAALLAFVVVYVSVLFSRRHMRQNVRQVLTALSNRSTGVRVLGELT